MTQKRVAMVGTFVVGGLLLFSVGLFFIGDRRLLFEKQFEVQTTFGKVTGLVVGTPVRLAGLSAGEVLEIRIPSRPSEPFLVRMRVREDLRPLVRTDSVAAVQTDGIVGNAFIQISVGTDDAPSVEPGTTIRGNDPIEFSDLIQEGRDTFRTVTAEVLELKEDVSGVIDVLTDTITKTNALIAGVGGDVGVLTNTAVQVVEEVQATIGEARRLLGEVTDGRGTVGRLLNDDALYTRLTGIAGEAERTMKNLRETTDTARLAVADFTGRDGTAQQISLAFRSTLLEIQEVTADLAEGTEALKRNFLFRGFFRDRGFFDLDAISREAYQAGVLEGKDRTALRVWIEADALFARGSDGIDRLTADGRRRLDSAMADLVRYPRDSPLVVEGYAESAEGAAAYLMSVDRAQAVRDYLLARFRRQTTLTDIMPMSDTAAGSPSGDKRWSGVALALFVRNDALRRANGGQP